MNGKLYKAKYSEWQLSLFGATFVAFGLGVVLAQYFGFLAFLLILIGIIMHGVGMYRIHKRNN